MKIKLVSRLLAAAVLAVAGLAVLNGCGGGSSGIGSNGNGTLVVHMSDAGNPDIIAMNITVTRVEANINGSWQTLSTAPQSFNLLDSLTATQNV